MAVVTELRIYWPGKEEIREDAGSLAIGSVHLKKSFFFSFFFFKDRINMGSISGLN